MVFEGDTAGNPAQLDAYLAGRRIHVTLDRAEALFEAPWLTAFQDIWRALVTCEGVSGRLTTLMLGRPVLRRVLGGEASPLANVACVVRARPLTVEQLSSNLHADPTIAKAVVRKTGGHPRLSRELHLATADGGLGTFGTVYQEFVEDFRDYVGRLIDDHGAAASAVVADLVRMRAQVSEEALLDRHFASSRGEGVTMLEDLTGSGLIGFTSSCPQRVRVPSPRTTPKAQGRPARQIRKAGCPLPKSRVPRTGSR
jgi:hypothetical protein